MKMTISLIAAVILAVPLVIGCHKGQAVDYKAIETEVKKDLPIGTPREKVDSYLTSHKIGHTFYKPENRIYALVPDTRKSVFGFSGSLSVTFSFDASDSLTNIQSQVQYTGP